MISKCTSDSPGRYQQTRVEKKTSKHKCFDGSTYRSLNALLQKRRNHLFQWTIHIGFLLILKTFSIGDIILDCVCHQQHDSTGKYVVNMNIIDTAQGSPGHSFIFAVYIV